ncbi:two component regulator with propeller domain [Arcticibacter pallidicorallinus]|uniref:histidine kinase n=1 Tax=Arcticibacter pallidicorallinus TaxID=1259464 RepID=A0A2T0U6Q9_9SPHI|nr:two-component regulator propeller domain-containing protein [Arcticibacter pallidicorallinus]PRY53599.1 two component regulator with propeller domain [Arcticibacter pallidicorallinus]
MFTIFCNSFWLKRFLLALAFCFSMSVRGREVNYNFKHYTINEGLSQNTVLCLLEDKDGVIWMGTADGLNKFDGYDFTHYKHQFRHAGGISNNQINALYEAKNGDIWVGTADGLNVFNKRTEKFTRLSTTVRRTVTSNDFITSIYEDSKGRVWLTSQEGLKLYDPGRKTFSVYPYLSNRRADRLMEDAQGILWISVDKDLRRFDPASKRYLPLPSILERDSSLRNSFVRVLTRDKENKIWIGTEAAGLFVYDARTNTLERFRSDKADPASLPADIIREIFFTRENKVLIGTRDGLSVFDSNTKTFANYKNDRFDPNSLSQNSIRDILQDRAGNIWLATFGGGVNLVAAGNGMFNYLGARTPNKEGLSYRMVSSIADAQDGALWIGTEGGGLNYWDRKNATFKTFALPQISSNIGANTIKCIYSEKGNLWLGTVNGLYFMDTSTGNLRKVELPVRNREIVSIVRIKDELWLATNGSGLVSLSDGGKTRTFTINAGDENSLTRNNVFKLLKDDADNLWVATNKGLNYFDGKKFIQYHVQENNPYSLTNSAISTVFIDSRKRVWIGTRGGGLNLFDKSKNRFYVVDHRYGLANDAIQSIEEDKRGNLWVSTNKGLSRITISGRPPFNKTAISISNYFVEDGLQSNQFMPNASHKTEGGELFFGGINGLTYFQPEDIERNTYKPPVILTEFLIRNIPVISYGEDSPLKRSINETDEITLQYDQVFISLKFAALNYVNPSKNKYAYKLEGLKRDGDWHYVDNQRIATYTNLAAGTYIFKVKASNNDGLWNESSKTLKIIVLPPWWKTWWAYLLYIVVIAGILYFYYYSSLKTAKLKNQLNYEHLIREKDNELYQRKLNFFTNISHEIKTPLTLILAPLEKLLSLNEGNNRLRQQLQLMKGNGERLMKLVHQLLDFRKFDSGNMNLQVAESNLVNFIKEVVAAFEGYAGHLGISLRVEAEKRVIKAWFDRDKFEKVLYNLLSNSMKFTKAGGSITIRVKQTEANDQNQGFAIVEVEDNGTGIAPENLGHIFEPFKHYDEDGANLQGSGLGLAFTKMLVELHHGEILVESTQRGGGQEGRTCFIVKIPLGRRHFDDKVIAPDYADSEAIGGYLDAEEPAGTRELLEKRTKDVLEKLELRPIMLIVEDNKDVMNFLKEHFEEKFDVETAFDGREGVDKAVASSPDIIISDVMMPVMSGTMLCSTLKTDNRTSHIPIILLTARSQTANTLEGLETGADDYITKPFNISIVEAKVWNLLEQRRLLRERYKKEITLQPQNLAITSPDEVFLSKVMTYIEANISEPGLNVEDLAKEVYMSRTTLYRKIKALTNQTTVEFIRAVRLKRAAQLLKTNNYGVSEIAYMTGFTDIDYFRKCFKEQFKKTPTEYLNEDKGGA